MEPAIKRKRNRVISDPWEVEYVHRQLPTFSEEEIERVMDDCNQRLRGSRSRKAMIECVRRKLA